MTYEQKVLHTEVLLKEYCRNQEYGLLTMYASHLEAHFNARLKEPYKVSSSIVLDAARRLRDSYPKNYDVLYGNMIEYVKDPSKIIFRGHLKCMKIGTIFDAEEVLIQC